MLFTVAVFAAIFLYRFHFYPDFGNGFIAGDWLINYEDGGFKRRGLSGTIAFIIQDLTNSNLTNVVYGIQLTIFFSFLAGMYLLVQKKEMNLLYVSLFFSPLAFLSYLNDYGYLGRKDMILFLVFVIFIYLLDRKKLNLYKEIFVLVSISIATLMHEIVLFYIPYFIFALFILNKRPEPVRYFFYFLAVVLPVGAIVLFGGPVNQGQSLGLLAERGVVLDQLNIFIEADNKHFSDLSTDKIFSYLLYLLSFIIGFLHFAFYIIKNHPRYKRYLIGGLLFSVFYSLPLFYLAVDWGRWLQVHFILSLILVTLILKNRDLHTGREVSFKNIFIHERFILLIFPILFLWGVFHCGTGFVPGGVVRTFYNLVF